MSILPKLRNWLVIFLGSLAAISLIFWLFQNAKFKAHSENQATKFPDYLVTHAQLQVMDHDGQLQYELTADKLAHYAKANLSLLTSPQLHEWQGQRLLCTINARQGRLSHTPGHAAEIEHLDLQDQVQINYFQNLNVLELSTAQLAYYPHKHLASGFQHVIIRQHAANQPPNSRLLVEGEGFNIDTLQQKIKILAKVNSKIHAERPTS